MPRSHWRPLLCCLALLTPMACKRAVEDPPPAEINTARQTSLAQTSATALLAAPYHEGLTVYAVDFDMKRKKVELTVLEDHGL